MPQLKIDTFTKFFFSKKSSSNQKDSESGSEEDNKGQSQPHRRNSSTLESFNQDNTSVASANKNRDINNKIKQLELMIKERVSNNWVSVRKAFLDLDEDFDGYLTAEDFSKLIGGAQSSAKKFDYSLVKMLLKLRSKN